MIVRFGTPVAVNRVFSLFLRYFLLLFNVSSCYNPIEIQLSPSPFPARKA